MRLSWTRVDKGACREKDAFLKSKLFLCYNRIGINDLQLLCKKLGVVMRLKIFECFFMLERDANIVEAMDHALFDRSFNVKTERDFALGVERHLLVLQADRRFQTGFARRGLENLVHFGLRKLYREKGIFSGIIAENIREGGDATTLGLPPRGD